MHNEAKKEREILIMSLKNRLVSLKFDSASKFKKHFLLINVQFSLNRVLKTMHLKTIKMKTRSTALNLRTQVNLTMKQYKINPQNVNAIAVDNAANMLSCINKINEDIKHLLNFELNEHESENELEYCRFSNNSDLIFNDIKESHLPNIEKICCASHMLQLAVKKTLKEIENNTRVELLIYYLELRMGILLKTPLVKSAIFLDPRFQNQLNETDKIEAISFICRFYMKTRHMFIDYGIDNNDIDNTNENQLKKLKQQMIILSDGGIVSVAVASDMQSYLVGRLDFNIYLMDLKNGALLNEYSGHLNKEYKITCGFLHDEDFVVSGSENGSVYVWNTVTGSCHSTLDHERKIIHHVSGHNKTESILTASGDNVYLWQL
ncbi:hypothetical protein A3Q56_06362 [Intoshia linei]|uniref:WD repeat domain-containing protein 83 n=1 Tax=Intoshia linei TaxID=1819745 RepID=A0A177AV97_9BILA|nr:hypothetical protein A3Q56_06362 [Intoshia linei]